MPEGTRGATSTPAGAPPPVIRHYRGPSRQAAEDAYRTDAAQALAGGYVPIAHRWAEDWNGHTLSVAYQLEQLAPVPSPPPAPPGGPFAPPTPRQAEPSPTTVQPTTVESAPPVPAPAAAQSPPPEPAATSEPPPLATAATVSTRATSAPRRIKPSRRTRLTINTLDLHCAGEPLRIVRSGFPDVPHLPVLQRRAWVREHADHVRRAIVHEPRGHRDMYAAVLLPPFAKDADICLLFLHNEGYSTMCGHGVIAVTTGLIEEGLFPADDPVTTIRFEVPAGIVAASASTIRRHDGSALVEGVRFTNVPAYLHARSLPIAPDGVELHGPAAQAGRLNVDLAFGGAYYGIVDAANLGLRVVPDQAEALRRAGAAITDVLRRDHTPAHPTDADLGFVYGTIIVDRQPASSPDGRARDAHLRNATVFADAELDRSPCGSGTSAILAQLHARGHLQTGSEIANAGITGEVFLGRIESETLLGPHPAVVTSIAGTAYVVGYSTLIVDARDPLGDGFVLR